MLQTTIHNTVSCYGIGVHLGQKTQITLKPASEDMGIVFLRSDVNSVNNIIHASYDKVCNTMMSTSIENDAKVRVSTIEHLMAAIWGCGIDNVLVEIDGSEVPIMDGSSMPFVFLIHCAGIKVLRKQKKYLKLEKEVSVSNASGSELSISPSSTSNINLSIDFENKIIGKQELIFQHNNRYTDNFKNNIADARTFGFLHELDYLKSKGLANGVSLENTIGIDNDKIMNSDGLRYDNEFVRHKMLDLMGDMFTAGAQFIGDVIGHKTSHELNNHLLRKIFSNKNNYSFITT